jgi:hypothetical protein
VAILTTLLEVLAAALIVMGVALMYIPAAVIVGGLALVGISFGLSRQRPSAARE